MSRIDGYQHRVLGTVTCPATHPLMYGNDTQRKVVLYYLLEDVPADETAFQGKAGDVLLGGGVGEAAALRISIPNAFTFFTKNQFVGDYAKAYWSPNKAFVFCEGYAKLGWTPSVEIEDWLTQHVLAFLLKEYPELFTQHAGNQPLLLDGSICTKETW